MREILEVRGLHASSVGRDLEDDGVSKDTTLELALQEATGRWQWEAILRAAAPGSGQGNQVQATAPGSAVTMPPRQDQDTGHSHRTRLYA